MAEFISFRKKFSWKQRWTQKLIFLVKERRFLYDPSHKDYRNDKARFREFCIIARIIGQGFDARQVDLKWRRLIISLTGEMEKVLKDNSYVPQWKWWKEMEFVREYVDIRRIKSTHAEPIQPESNRETFNNKVSAPGPSQPTRQLSLSDLKAILRSLVSRFSSEVIGLPDTTTGLMLMPALENFMESNDLFALGNGPALKEWGDDDDDDIDFDDDD